MISIALTNANNCQNQGKGCTNPAPIRLVGIFQRAFEKQVKKKKKKRVKKRGIFSHPNINQISFLRIRDREEKEAQKNKAQSFLFFSFSVLNNTKLPRPLTFRRFDYIDCAFTFCSASLTR